MNKKAWAVVVIISIVIVTALVYVATRPDKMPPNGSTVQEKDQSNPQSQDTPSTAATKGTYVDYSEQALEQAAETRLLFFYAPWCPQCREMEASIRSDGVPDNVTVLKVDYDSNQQLREKYGVTLQTTFVKVDKNGNKIKSYVAYEEPQFSAVRRELLP